VADHQSQALAREHDYPRYVATLFAPAGKRADLFALYAFAAEIERIPARVSDPTLGEIRLTWWADALKRTLGEGAAESPALTALAAAIRRNSLPAQAFLDLIDARADDLYADPPASRDALERHLGATESVLFQLAALVLGSNGRETADLSGHAGIAYGLARSFLAGTAPRRSLVPADWPQETEGTATQALGELVALAGHHLTAARRAASTVRAPVGAAYLPLALVAPVLRRLEKGAGNTVLPRLALLSRISAAGLTGKWRRF